MKFRFLF